ncbi:Uncharacterised protein [Niallia circulans]|jgi:hypothetical protein|uniref:Uncharacterized protein n=1 Tax=Niallia circulans TaxID=1397 RepID=A0A0J1LCT1_NIACI|nr:hypothetical protein [Niallia circulans]KLV26780.1 hypothetical protein ABW02_09555 [Niallia circulans]MDR4317134.1 hypothetical protein [Niallia circulans]MED3838115.1 hypothetical protein [Niallia circulans]MED4241555.1 hypothetical protein [Niallia circulans]MED4247187.1 hypothetical protein [Niallia circulans]
MVTFAYLLIFTSMSVLTIVLDIFVFHDGFMKCIKRIYDAEVGAGAITIVFTAILGFVWSVVVDIRLWKNKKQRRQKTQG